MMRSYHLKRTIAAALAAVVQTAAVRADDDPHLGKPAPELTAPLFQGGSFSLEALKGKVVLVSYWATWCAPCRAEMPVLDTFYKQHHGDGLELVALSVDKEKDRERARKAMQKLSYSGAMLKDAVPDGFGQPEGAPLTYVIDRSGVVRDRFIAVDPKLLSDVLLPLLHEKAATAEVHR
jgi:cytochrome c biogenesis protein CcmG/thiol:disulfide interchange protein DsbE